MIGEVQFIFSEIKLAIFDPSFLHLILILVRKNGNTKGF